MEVGRAIAALHDYLVYLIDRGAAVPGSHARKARNVAPMARGGVGYASDTTFTPAKLAKTNRWMKAKERQWKRAGRINAYGLLKVGLEPVPPLTLTRIGKVWPHLNLGYRVAVLLSLNGVWEARDMEAKEMVIECLEAIVDKRMERLFGEVLAEVRRPGLPPERSAPEAAKPRKKYTKRVRDPRTGKLVPRAELEAEAAMEHRDLGHAEVRA